MAGGPGLEIKSTLDYLQPDRPKRDVDGPL
jgi:hypothetical protein